MIGRAGLKKRVGEVLLYVLLAALGEGLLATQATGKLQLGVLGGFLVGAVPLVVSGAWRGAPGWPWAGRRSAS
jgi:hypothetical protein